MASKLKMVWGVDIGNQSLKAMRLRDNGESIEVVGLDVIEHSKSLIGLGQEQKNVVISETLGKFVEKHNITKTDDVAISVPGQSSFARFISLPPVEPKGIPKIVQYEAVQQIPFDINEVEWDWQIMEKPDSPDTEVGIFAIKNELITNILEPFTQQNMKITTVQMGPMAIYNYACHEFKELDDAGKKAVIVINMGTENTELVVCSKTKVWQRVIPIGGNTFTQAIADAFKIPFEKAEKLKKTAPMSKYAKQIFHAMRPVFTDMGSEIQRSIGYFSSSARGVKFTKVVALGGAMKLQGVTKYLQQSLQMPVARPETYESINVSSEVSSAALHENISDLGISYGLAIQGLGYARISSNLLPRRIARAMAWARKAQIMTVAAGILLLVSFISFGKTLMDQKSYDRMDNVRRETSSIVRDAEQASRKLSSEERKQQEYEDIIAESFEVFKYRKSLPLFKQTILRCLPNEESNPQQAALYKAFKEGDVEEVTEIPRDERKQVFVTSMRITFAPDLRAANFGENSSNRVTSSRTGGGGGADLGGFGGMPGMPGFGGPGMGGDAGFESPRDSRRSSRRDEDDDQQDEAKNGPGFIVEIEGYSPYKDINKLLDPTFVSESDRSSWGIVTHFKNLDQLFDANSPFEILDTSTTSQFIQETGEVDLQDSTMPSGIGVLENIQRAETPSDSQGNRSQKDSNVIYEESVLVDPLTGEEISKTYVLDEYSRIQKDNFGNTLYNTNDRWFRIKAKFIWKDAPETETDNSK